MDKKEIALSTSDGNIDSSNVIKGNENKELVYKTKDYVRRAKNNYYNKKKVNDEEFREKERERLKKWREDNREQINERARMRRREVKKQKEGTVLIIGKEHFVESGNDKSISKSIDELVIKTENINMG